jgi:hypothetical protein
MYYLESRGDTTTFVLVSQWILCISLEDLG